MKVSVIIPTLNRPADLDSALNSLMRQIALPAEIIIVDQSTNSRSKEVLSQIQAAHAQKPVRFEYLVQEEKSLVKARNAGLAKATGEIVSFLDDDVVLFREYYREVIHHFKENASTGALSGSTIVKKWPSGVKWEVRKMVMRIFLISHFDGRMTSSGFGYPICERKIEATTPVDLLPGCNMNFRRDRLQGERFDEWFYGYSFREDVDYSYRVSKKTRLVMISEARLSHNYSTESRLDAGSLKKMEIRNYHYLFKKHKDRGWISRFLFAYSLSGLLLIEFFEFLTVWKSERFEKFWIAVGAALSLAAPKIDKGIKYAKEQTFERGRGQGTAPIRAHQNIRPAVRALWQASEGSSRSHRDETP
ncbi:MAG: glycosyltransferase family 2 protein [Candidatus Omnitrophica bacterium]|nr:glycosyltransferase family 2 protein [Candidatus Omnitrophota bacterium]